jgi:hypothetical protein
MKVPVTPSTPHAPPRQLPLPLEPALDLQDLFGKVFLRLKINQPLPRFQAEYRPFAGLRSTISVRNNHVQVRISDVLEDAPHLVLEALAEILVAQVFRRRASREARECYLAYVFRPAVRRRIDDARRRRSRKRCLPARGRCYDLNNIFQRLNRLFFGGELSTQRLGWSSRRWRTILGHYDSANTTIVISRLLDSPAVPRYLIEYLVYHEMLHVRFPTERNGFRRVLHSRQFREWEKKFPKYEQARRDLRQMSS